jgi:hypothetical protein
VALSDSVVQWQSVAVARTQWQWRSIHNTTYTIHSSVHSARHGEAKDLTLHDRGRGRGQGRRGHGRGPGRRQQRLGRVGPLPDEDSDDNGDKPGGDDGGGDGGEDADGLQSYLPMFKNNGFEL